MHSEWTRRVPITEPAQPTDRYINKLAYISATKNGKQQNLIHCNWGWGSSKFYNGYYLSKVFDTNSGPEIYDNEVTRSGQSGYYKYNLEYSIISR